MSVRTLILSLLCASFVTAAAAPAFANSDDWRRHETREQPRRGWQEHRRPEHEWRGRHGYHAPAPVVVAPQVFAAPGTYSPHY